MVRGFVILEVYGEIIVLVSNFKLLPRVFG